MSELPLKGPLEHCLPVGFELLLRQLQVFNAFVELAEELFYFGDNGLLDGEWGRGQRILT